MPGIPHAILLLIHVSVGLLIVTPSVQVDPELDTPVFALSVSDFDILAGIVMARSTNFRPCNRRELNKSMGDVEGRVVFVFRENNFACRPEDSLRTVQEAGGVAMVEIAYEDAVAGDRMFTW